MADDDKRRTIFLSYARGDQAQAERLAAALDRCGFIVWWDALIEGGTRYAASIDEALNSADAVVVLWSRRSVESDWVKDEAAQGRDRRRLVPLSLDGTAPPLGFRQFQMIDLSGWRGRADAPQLDAICRAVSAAAGGEPDKRPQTVARTALSRRQAIGGAGAAAALLAGGGALVAWRKGLFGGGPGARSIAVLPFENVGGDPAQTSLAEGLTDEVRSALSLNPALKVLAGTSSNSAQSAGGDARTIAARLGVAYLLEGSVQRSGDKVRVATNLTDGRTGFSAWSQRVERQLGDIFAFEGEIARMVSNALSAKMATTEPAPGGTRNARAYEAYSRGRSLFNLAKDAETDNQARANFELAIDADPNFALAHAGLSRVLSGIAAEHAEASELKPLYARAIAEAQRAVAIAPTLAEGHLALGYALFSGRLDLRGARPSYDRAYRYGRGDADIVLLCAVYMARARRFGEAREAIERALALDPLNPRTHRAAGNIAFAERRFGDATAQYQRALQLNPAISNAHAFIGDALLLTGKIDQARAAYAAEPHDLFRLRGQAILEQRAGNQAAAQQALDALMEGEGDASVYQQAEVMAQWNRPDQAMALLERARVVGDSGLSLIGTDPLLDPIARDPRLLRLREQIGI